MKLNDVVCFRGDRLFNGAVNIDWFDSDETRKRSASEAFVFHGPNYHGVSQDDVGTDHGHHLQDTASFTRSVIRRCYGLEDEPFTLAIAGYGTGKSHLGLTLATLLGDPEGEIAGTILAGIQRADQAIASDIRAVLSEHKKPCLVVALNGMKSFDLTTEVTRQVLQQLKMAGLNSRPLDELRPRFRQAANLVRFSESNTEVTSALREECGLDNTQMILTLLEQQDEAIYSRVHKVLAEKGIQISALGGESIRDVIQVACREYCGDDKHFKSLVIIFDEFGRFTEFATVRSHVAGSGVLQDLFEGVQANSDRASFAGFIQFDLNAYVQRVAPEHRNEILRYVTRYRSAKRAYLSINLETLIANLIEKKRPTDLSRRFDTNASRQESTDIATNIARWFPQSANHRLWSQNEQFHNVVRQGCWPLSAYSTWFLFHLAAAGKHLQERSALALLSDAFSRFGTRELDHDHDWAIAPADFWSDALQQELILSEEGGQQGSITHAFCSVYARHGTQIGQDLLQLLRAVVIASKMGMKAANQEDAIEAISEIAGIHLRLATEGITQLKDEYNVLEWDESFKQFDILGDAVPRTQFLQFVRHRVASSFDEAGKSQLFASKGSTWCELLQDLDCDFAEANRITTKEWIYRAVTSNCDLLPMHVAQASNAWAEANTVDEPRGTIIYCYAEPSRDFESVSGDAKRLLRSAAQAANVNCLPILIVFLCDTEGSLGQSIAELAVLEESVSEEDRLRFGNLIPAHLEKTRSAVRSHVDHMIKKRHYICGHQDPIEAKRLSRVGSELFSRIYKTVLSFPFDGFSTSRGNAADTCQELTCELLQGHLDWNTVISKPAKIKNRASTVLKDEWGIFAQNGKIRTRPQHPVVRTLTEKWDEMLNGGEQRIPLQDVIKELCRPPYGANIASAGLFLGTFLAARNGKLFLIRNDQQFTVSQLLQNNLFKRKFIDLGALRGLYLIPLGEESSEWETLLDEWETSETHLDMVSNWKRAENLKARVPIPPVQSYRYVTLESKSRFSYSEIQKAETRKSQALEKIERGIRGNNANNIARGAAELVDLANEMKREAPLWSEHQIQEIESDVPTVKQNIIQIFPEWLGNQGPDSESPDDVGRFKHMMLHLTGSNLKKLGLDAQYEQLDARVKHVVKNVEVIAEAHQLIREVSNWLTSHKGASSYARVSELRALQKVGVSHRSKLKGLAQRTEIPEVGIVRVQLNENLDKMSEAENGLVNRLKKLWDSKLGSSLDDLADLADEVDALIGAFEGCPDLEDLQNMRRALRLYQNNYRDLDDDRLNWEEFESLSKRLLNEANQDENLEELPWPPDEAISAIVKRVKKNRTLLSEAWIKSLELEASTVSKMPVTEANALHVRISTWPPFLTKPHCKHLKLILDKVNARLEELELDWLIERFTLLPDSSKADFLKKAQSLVKMS